VIQIGVLPDDVLLEIFDFYVVMHLSDVYKSEIEAWILLVHVCRRWRSLVSQSQRRLDLQLYCRPETPANDTLDIWPSLPLIISGSMTSSGMDNVITALGQSNRVCKVFLWQLADWQLEEVLAAMQVPFPELTELWLHTRDKSPPVVIPKSFLGGSPSRLEFFHLHGIPFPGSANLILSSDHLVKLSLTDIPHPGYILPEAMATLLSMLSSLRTLRLRFRSPQSRPDLESRGLPLPKRSILPSLDDFHFKGATEYFEELVARIDTPQLDRIEITFFNQIDFDTPRLVQFINRTPTLRAFDEARVYFNDSAASVTLRCRKTESGLDVLRINISCSESDWQLSSIEQICNTSLPPLSTVEDLYIMHRYPQPFWKNDAIENTLWLRLLLPFTAAQNLYIHKEFAPFIVTALQELVGVRITEVLPNLQNIFLNDLEPSGPLKDDIEQFVAARRFSNHPIAISDWK
jgi:hypothetical protein